MRTILLIEPDVLLAKTYQRALAGANFQVNHVVSAQTAIDSADAARPDLVILELQLPAHNGIEFLHEFRSYPEWQPVPIIINTYLTPLDLEPVQRTLQEEFGVRAVHYKPHIALQLLVRSATEILAGQGQMV